MTTFDLSNAAGQGFRMNAIAGQGFSFINPNSKLLITDVLSDDGTTAFLAVTGAGAIDTIGINYSLNGDNLFIEDVYYFSGPTTILTIDNWNLLVSASVLAAGGYIAFEINTLNDIFYGNDFADRIFAGPGKDVVFGYGGRDRLSGNGQADLLLGGAGNDTLFGDSGADGLYGSSGTDVQFGGSGNDTFFYSFTSDSRSANMDVIGDFLHSADNIDVEDIDAKVHTTGNNTFQFIGHRAFTAEGQIRAVQSGADTIVQINSDGSSTPEMGIKLQNFTASTLTAADFIL